MHNLPFSQPGRFWKGNLHTHSTASDGRLSPEEVCARYREAGYDFIALTDHFMRHYNFPLVDTRPYRTTDFTTILGAELHTRNVMTEMGSLWHILAVGLPLDFAETGDDETAAQLASRALEAGAFVAVAHPNWYALTEKDFDDLGQVDAVEVFNGTAVDHNDRMDSWHITDIMLGRGRRYTTCATDDFHGKLDRHDFTLGWVQVKSERLDPSALLAAFKAGHYYSSTGPEIYDIQVTPGEKVYVRCSAASRIFLTGKASSSRAAFGNGVTEAEFDIRKFGSPYCRVTVRDYHGGRAWSNPIWL
jgi:predicted metal-dependent phosphoesterase TrpH